MRNKDSRLQKALLGGGSSVRSVSLCFSELNLEIWRLNNRIPCHRFQYRITKKKMYCSVSINQKAVEVILSLEQ